MSGMGHGKTLSVAEALAFRQSRLGGTASPFLASIEAAPPGSGFTTMFPDLRTAEHQLPSDLRTRDGLAAVGAAMVVDDALDSTLGIPAAYTYFGQFLDHDITKQGDSTDAELTAFLTNPAPAPLQDLFSRIANARTGRLDLDCVYEAAVPGGVPPPRDGDRLRVDNVSGVPPQFGALPPGKTRDNDLPRDPVTSAALIGDPRNDENLLVAQLHVAFLRAHGVLSAGPGGFSGARTALRRIFQNIALNDFLVRIGDPDTLTAIRAGDRIWRPDEAQTGALPIEYSTAAYRFGHSMVRQSYDFNLNFGAGGRVAPEATLADLFTFSQLSGGMRGALPENWVVQWERVLNQPASAIDSALVRPLDQLPGGAGPGDIIARLATRNLIRGFLFGLPTGQAVAARLGASVLAGDDLLDAVPETNPALRAALRDHDLHHRTPLWAYILIEAGASGGRLGVAGTRIIGETLYALVEASEDSILTTPPTPAEALDLPGLLRLSGNLV